MKKLYAQCLGSENLLEQKLYIGICLISIVGLLLIILYNLFYQLYVDVMICTVGIMISSVFYYMSRFQNRYFNVGFYIFFTTLISLTYFQEFGLSGPIPYFYVTILVFALVYSPVQWHLRLISITLLLFVTVLSLGALFPGLIHNPYKNQQNLSLDLIAAVIITLLFCYMAIYFLRKNYELERNTNLTQKLQLEHSTQQKSLFFINLSHEIKTPLTLIENYLDKYIAKKGDDEELLIIQQNIRKLRQDMIDYLNFENLERGQISFQSKNILNLGNFIDEKIQLFIPFADRKKLTIHHTVENNTFIEFSIQGLDQILNNLLENAGKYTPENGDVTILLTKENNFAILTIQNSGTVINPEQLTHLFEPFYQLSNEKLNAQGIGMGLYTIKKIIDNSNSTIAVESSSEIGVKFRISIPLHDLQDEAAQPDNLRPTYAFSNISRKVTDGTYQTNRFNILIVEDNADLLRYLRDELTGNYNVFVAENGLNALEKLEKIPLPHILISDIMMDKMDGYDLLETTYNESRFSHIPVIFLSANGTLKEKINGLQRGAIDFIAKPFSMDELKFKIKNTIDCLQKNAELSKMEYKTQFSTQKQDNIANQGARLLEKNFAFYKFTTREKDVLIQLKQGFKYEEIGETLHISEHTVIRHVQNIYKKTDSTTKIDLLQKMYSE